MDLENFEYSQEEYEHTWDIVADMVPYSDPDYKQKVHEMVLSVLWSEKHPDPYLEEVCKQHDEMLEQGLIEW